MLNILVTGGCGFIGSNFVEKLLKETEHNVVIIDKMDFGSSVKNIFENSEKYHYYYRNICDEAFISSTLTKYNIDVIYHFAAQTHVDRSFISGVPFIVDNVLGTVMLLECAKKYNKLKKFILVSTDEIYGDSENSKPTNPYAGSKLCAEIMAYTYHKSYNIPLIITRSNNVYGPRQYPEINNNKIIPKFISLLKANEKCTIYGKGGALRKYLYIDDVCNAYLLILEKGISGKTYEISSKYEISALDLAYKIISIIKPQELKNKYINFVSDRPYHDIKYSLDLSNNEIYDLGWEQKTGLDEGLKLTIDSFGGE